jgi:hypothetical protein
MDKIKPNRLPEKAACRAVLFGNSWEFWPLRMSVASFLKGVFLIVPGRHHCI